MNQIVASSGVNEKPAAVTSLPALIEKVKSLGSGREVDAEIAVTVDGGEIVWLMANGTMETYPARKYASSNHVGGFGKAYIPAYTTSVDAAMTLVPEGCGYILMNCAAKVGRSIAGAPTPALALTLAALQARLVGEG